MWINSSGALNTGGFRQLFNDVLLPFMQNVDQAIAEPQGDPAYPYWSAKHFVLTLDGETAQICGVVNDEMLDIWEHANVHVFKHSANCSGSEQPNDLSPWFRTLKRLTKEKRCP